MVDCPKDSMGRQRVFTIVAAEVAQIVGTGNSDEREDALVLLDSATSLSYRTI